MIYHARRWRGSINRTPTIEIILGFDKSNPYNTRNLQLIKRIKGRVEADFVDWGFHRGQGSKDQLQVSGCKSQEVKDKRSVSGFRLQVSRSER